MTGVYDPTTNQLFWPTGNPAPSNRGEGRTGDNLYSNSLLALNPDTISTACPYCLVMLGDAVAAKKSSGDAPDTLEVVDVAQLLARSVRSAAPAVADGDGGTDGTGAS